MTIQQYAFLFFLSLENTVFALPFGKPLMAHIRVQVWPVESVQPASEKVMRFHNIRLVAGAPGEFRDEHIKRIRYRSIRIRGDHRFDFVFVRNRKRTSAVMFDPDEFFLEYEAPPF